MPESFDAAKQRLGRVQNKPYVPLADRANSGNTGLLANLPGSYASKISSQAAPDPQSAPPKAADAPTKGNNNLFTGLADALNKYQRDQEKKYPGYVADEYVFEFKPAEIATAKVTPPAQPVNYKNTAAKNVKTAQDRLDSDTDSVNVNSQRWSILAGTQIVQLIDQIMRSSSYVSDQAKVTVDEDGQNEKNEKANPGGVTAWYKISVSAEQLKYDTFRRDHAYRITFLISAYKINQMCSIYFNDSKLLGAHKAYDYWFTGLNTQILSYEQEYNQSYYTTVTQSSGGLASTPPTGRDQMKQAVLATSEQRTQGQANYVNAAADSASAFLYSIGDFAEVRMMILGDPAWMQQGEVSYGVSAQNFEFSAFNSDGSINYDSQQVTYSVRFNRPTDYDFTTGIMNVNSASGAPQELFRFQARSCKNIFSKGEFKQELVGVLIPPTTNAPPTSNGRPTQVSSATNNRANKLAESKAQAADESIAASIAADRSGSLTAAEFGGPDALALGVGATPAPQPAARPAPPTSTGDLEFGGDDTLQSLTAGTAPPKLSTGSSFIGSRLQRLNQPQAPNPNAAQIIAKDD